jgi:hypothetical protein
MRYFYEGGKRKINDHNVWDKMHNY